MQTNASACSVLIKRLKIDSYLCLIFFSFVSKTHQSMTLLSLRSFAKPPPASAPDGWRLHQHPPAHVQHPRPDLQPRCRGTPGSRASRGIQLAHVPRSAERGTSLWGHCDRGSRRPTRRQQLAVWGWCFLQLGLPRSRVAKTRGFESRPPAMMDRKYKLKADVRNLKRHFLVSLEEYLGFVSFMFEASMLSKWTFVKMHLFFNRLTLKEWKTRLL